LVLVPAWPRQLDELGTFAGTYARCEDKSSGADQSGQKGLDLSWTKFGAMPDLGKAVNDVS